MTAASLHAERVSVMLSGRRIIEDVSVRAAPGQVIGIVGPNGSGKSTLLRTFARTVTPVSGTIRIDDVDIATVPVRQTARMVAAVLQDSTGDFDLRARDVVAMGRAPYKRMFQRDGEFDARIIDRSLQWVGAAHLADRPIALMSGGERQRVMIARALAQQPGLLVLDEPTNHLDIRHQFEVLGLPARLGVTAVMALHDLNLAAHYCDRIHVLHQGRQVCAGTPSEVLTAELIAQVYRVSATVRPHPLTGRPQVDYDPGQSGFAHREPNDFADQHPFQ
jgi:iron complex transport system ATP-binding protein